MLGTEQIPVTERLIFFRKNRIKFSNKCLCRRTMGDVAVLKPGIVAVVACQVWSCGRWPPGIVGPRSPVHSQPRQGIPAAQRSHAQSYRLKAAWLASLFAGTQPPSVNTPGSLRASFESPPKGGGDGVLSIFVRLPAGMLFGHLFQIRGKKVWGIYFGSVTT